MRISELIGRDKDQIIAEWTVACAALMRVHRLPALVLLDHLPEILSGVATWIDADACEPPPTFYAYAKKHGSDRFKHEIPLRDVVSEYGILRRTLLQRLLAVASPSPQEIDRLDAALDVAIAASVEHYVAERDQAMHNEVERTRFALDAAALGTWEYRPVTGELLCDPRCRTLFGIAHAAPFALRDLLDAVHPGDRAWVEASLRHAVSAGGEYHVEHRSIGVEDGRERWIDVRGRVAMRDADGRATRLAGVVLEVTARKLVEQARDTFLGILGHDLGNPVSSVAMGARALARSTSLTSAERRMVALIDESAARMSRLISDLLDFTRSRLGGGLPVKRARVDMREICRHVVDECQSAHPDRRLQLEVVGANDSEQDTTGLWDRDRAMQAISNLVGNAVKHGSDPVRVVVRAEALDVVVVVENSGRPIAPDQIVTLFEPFRRGRSSDRTGLGLGLYIAREVMRSHRGTIDVRSDEERTAFTTRWPRHDAAPA